MKQLSFSGEELIEKKVKPHAAGGGYLYLPGKWIGKWVAIVRLE